MVIVHHASVDERRDGHEQQQHVHGKEQLQLGDDGKAVGAARDLLGRDEEELHSPVPLGNRGVGGRELARKRVSSGSSTLFDGGVVCSVFM